jgi:hypothetical protein
MSHRLHSKEPVNQLHCGVQDSGLQVKFHVDLHEPVDKYLTHLLVDVIVSTQVSVLWKSASLPAHTQFDNRITGARAAPTSLCR